ncbi:MAG: DsrE/DsrF/DrsH-like family protein [Verrucomicrobia bacterium]|nr:DsrE/DsrF/DrsH-like family protein [Verrucomicrobiota bacterium]
MNTELPNPDTAPTPAEAPADRVSIILFSGDLDKALAAFVIANGALAMDMRVTMFFAFWGLNVLRKEHGAPCKKDLLARMFGWMMPRGPANMRLSKMHFGGLGTTMMKHVMKKKNVYGLPQLVETARKNGARLIACTMSMDVMGLAHTELLDGVEPGGVATFLAEAARSKTTLFI